MQIDKIVGPLNHKHKESDIKELTGKYVKVAGDTMTGDLVFPVDGFVMIDANGVYWRVTVGTDGNLTTETGAIVTGILTEAGEYLLTEADEYLIQE